MVNCRRALFVTLEFVAKNLRAFEQINARALVYFLSWKVGSRFVQKYPFACTAVQIRHGPGLMEAD